MSQDPRTIKRIIIVIGFILLFFITGFLLWYFLAPPATCTDKKQNQSEKGIDCGGPCSPCQQANQGQDIIVKETALAFGGNDTYDVVAKISNPNDILGTNSFDYVFTLKDASGKVVATKEGSSFILPADSKYVAQLAVQTQGNVQPTSVEFLTKNAKWEKLSGAEKPQLGIYNKKFSPLPTGVGSEVDGVLRNESAYDLNKIFLTIILRDEKGKIIAVNTTEQNVVRAKEERTFRLTWPYELGGSIASMEIDSQSNVFDKQNFVTSPYGN